MKLFVTILAALLLAGCASPVQLERKTKFTSADVVDNRTPEQRAHHRSSNFSAISIMADDRFSPRAIDLFVDELIVRWNPTVERPIKVEVDQFHIIDFFPGRLSAGGQGWLGDMILRSLVDSNTDWTFVESIGISRSDDSLICIFVGKINGAPIKIATAETYKISPFAVLVANDPDFRRALDVTIRRAASQAVTRALGGAR